MPKSKRNKMVSLTKVKSKGRQGKEELVEKVQGSFEEFAHQYVLSFENMRSGPFKQLQGEMKTSSRFFLGKNKVMMRALGKSSEDEFQDNSAQLSKYLHGQVCLAFSNLDQKEFEAKLKEFEVEDFAQQGQTATYTVFLQKGTEALEGYAHSLEPTFRQLGLPTKLNFQKIELLSDVYVCKLDTELSVEQAKLLKLLGHKMSKFTLKVLVHRSKKGKIRQSEYGEDHLNKIKQSEYGEDHLNKIRQSEYG
eukprot:CAMPEP_0168615904 /NCGR_PEP_ID=MMETSP0449_2-20121227/4745_1 /TAXON_ID=1082188 /ORGANISM="Strombidium rassoulzadegani, Strain ras09" /LENGTH=249 /DNA_ID=CAMNT_0008656659 /DNA_START=15 /DNA_END=761 /DNA_ORIENTATION=-